MGNVVVPPLRHTGVPFFPTPTTEPTGQAMHTVEFLSAPGCPVIPAGHPGKHVRGSSDSSVYVMLAVFKEAQGR